MRMVSKAAYAVLLLGDIGVLYASVWLALTVRHFAVPSSDVAAVHLVAFSLLLPLWFVVFFIAGLYDRYTNFFKSRLPTTILLAQCINTIIAALFFFAVPLFAITPKTVLALFLLISTVLLLIFRVLIFPRLPLRRLIGAVVVGTGSDVTDTAHAVHTDSAYPLVVRAIVHPELHDTEVLKKTIAAQVARPDVQVLIIDTENAAIQPLLPFIQQVAFVERAVVYSSFTDVYEEVFGKVSLASVTDTWILRAVPHTLHSVYDIAKRVFDVVLAGVLSVPTVITAPFILFAIYIETGTPLVITQCRIGLGGRIIRIYKFRSMTKDEQGVDALQSTAQVTMVGAFLRRTRLDELPQIINVLRGDLSFIGPRPELPALAEAYAKEISYYHVRHTVRPGLSGWAQLQHDAHPHHGVNVAATREKLAYDLYYIKHRSWWLDIYIVLRTAWVLLTKKGS